jgi:hypothetical protein
MMVSVVPVFLSGGARRFDNVPGGRLEQVSVIDAPGVAHLRYRAG